MKNVIKTLLAIAAMVASAAIIESCTDGKANTAAIPRATESIPVTVALLERSVSTTTMVASGQLTTDDETVLGFKTGGVIENVLVKEGDRVKKGQLLARLNLTEINALVSQARHAYEKSQRDFQRVSNLYRDSVATLEQFQNAETGLSVAKEQFDAANFNRSHSEIHAPADGFVLRKFANAGQVIGIGDPVVQTNGAGSGKWVLKIGVSDVQWASVSIGSSATVRCDAFPEKSFAATVSRKSEAADKFTGAFTVELQVDAQGAKFASGMFGAATIVSQSNRKTWQVPYEAVLDANGDEGFVFVTNDEKTAIRKAVKIESFDGNSVHISAGLEDAQALIVSGSAYLSDNSPITVLK